jgi:hypothetical protein
MIFSGFRGDSVFVARYEFCFYNMKNQTQAARSPSSLEVACDSAKENSPEGDKSWLNSRNPSLSTTTRRRQRNGWTPWLA